MGDSRPVLYQVSGHRTWLGRSLPDPLKGYSVRCLFTTVLLFLVFTTLLGLGFQVDVTRMNSDPDVNKFFFFFFLGRVVGSGPYLQMTIPSHVFSLGGVGWGSDGDFVSTCPLRLLTRTCPCDSFWEVVGSGVGFLFH